MGAEEGITSLFTSHLKVRKWKKAAKLTRVRFKSIPAYYKTPHWTVCVKASGMVAIKPPHLKAFVYLKSITFSLEQYFWL